MLTDQQVVQLLQSGKTTQQDQALNFLYQELYGMIEAMVVENTGSKEQVKDIFQDGIVVLFNMVNKEGFELKSQLKTLFYSICRNKWLMVLRKAKRVTTLEDKHSFIAIEEDHFKKIVLTEKKRLVIEMLDKLSEECRKTLRLFYFEKQKMSKIAELMGLSSEAVAKNKKSNCMKHLRKIAMSNPIYQNNLQ